MSNEAPAAAAEASVPAEGNAAEALAAAAAPAPAAAPPPPAPEEPAADEVDLDTEAADDVYSDPAKAKAYAEKLRKEAAKHRVAAKEAREAAKDPAFDGWTENDAKVLREVIQIAAQDKTTGAKALREIADALDQGDVEGAAQIAAENSEAAANALTPEDVEAQVQRALEQADKDRAIKAEADKIIAQAKEWGYDPEAEDGRYFQLLHIATHHTGGDLEKAHEKMEALRQAVVDEYVNGVRERAANAPLHAPKPEDSVIDPQGENKTWESARSRVEQRLVNLRKG